MEDNTSEIELLINEIAIEVDDLENIEAACQETLNNYKTKNEDLQGMRLKMIAWDLS